MDEDVADTVGTYDEVAEEYRERHQDRESVADQVAWFLDALDDSASPTRPDPDAARTARPRVLDVGCGPGWETATLAERGCAPVGIDLTPRFLDLARREAPGADFCRMDMRTLGIDDGSADGLWACASFLHVPREDAPETLAEFARVLRDGAPVQLSVKRGRGRRRGDTYENDDRRFTLWSPDDLRNRITNAGFEILRLNADEWIAVTARA